MKIKIYFLLLIVFPSFINSQWKQTNGPNGALIEKLTVNQNCVFAAIYEHGLFCSSDKGTTWEQIANGLIPNTDNTFYNNLVSYDGDIFLGMNKGLFISSDNGNNWSNIADQLYDKNVTAIIKYKNKLIVGTYFGHVFSSPDLGKNWSDIGNLSPIRINTFAAKNDTLFAGTFNGVYFSLDEGYNWNPLHNDGMYTQSISDIIIDGKDIYVSSDNGHGVSVSTDGGYRWNSLLKNPEIVYKLLNVTGKLYAATTQGLYEYSKANNSWNIVSQLNREIRSAAFQDSTIYIGYWGTGIFSYTITTKNYKNLSNSLPYTHIKNISYKNSALYASTYHSGIFKSTDFGETWLSLNNPTANSFLVNDKQLWSYNERELFHSTDEGQNWTIINSVPTNNDIIISDLETDGSNIFLGTQTINPFGSVSMPSGFFRSTDNGQSWENLNIGLTTSDITYIDYFDDKLRVYAGNNIFYSTDKGNSWILENNLMPQSTFIGGSNGQYFSEKNDTLYYTNDNWQTLHSLKFYITDAYLITAASNGNKLYVGTNKGVFLYDSNKSLWKSANNGLTNKYIRSLEIIGDQLFAGTSGDGIWKCSVNDTITDIANNFIPTTFSLSQNYPNPFNPETTIEYSIPKSEHVTLKVYDLLGREVATLVDEFKQAGKYNSKLNTQNYKLPSGVYFYRLQTGSYSETKKLILIK